MAGIRPAVLLLLLIALARSPLAAHGQGPQPQGQAGQPAANAGSDTPQSFFEIVHAGGLVGYVIMFLSVVAVALGIECGMTLRASVLMPPDLAEQVREHLKAGHVAQAEQHCKLHPSVLAFVLQAGLAEIDAGWSAMEKAMEDAMADQSARLFRKVEYLSVIGNIAPMLGLLGTVIGMVMAFRQVAVSQGAAQAADLAEGIYLALVTTVQGLIVAIPSLSAFAVFRNRVDQLVAETTYMAQHVFAPLKRNRRQRPVASASAVVPPPPPRERGA